MGPIGARVEAATDALRELLRSRGCVLGYLFGSVAADRERPDSDLDIAVLLGPGVPSDRYFDVAVDLTTEIIGLTHTDDVDVVILNAAPPLLAYEAIATGRLLHGSHEDRVAFEVAVIKRLIDTEPIRAAQQRAFLARIDAMAAQLGEGKGRW
jgi:predicted nucleotidyltransferase